jgi:hypothetical protein
VKTHYYLRMGPQHPWREVTEETYVQAERDQDIYPDAGRPQDKPASSSFGVSGGVQGKVRYDLRGALTPSFKMTESAG